MNIIYSKPLPASLARRLAEAADGYRNIEKVYFVVGIKKPHPINVFFSLQDAEDYFNKHQLSDDYLIVGPYHTGDEVQTIPRVEDIEKVVVNIYFEKGKGEPQTATFVGQVDALFFNLSSLEKFAFPYYCGIFGLEYITEMREAALEKYIAKPDKLVMTAHGGCTVTGLIPQELIPELQKESPEEETP